jgi:hypothetical protein
MEKLYETIFDLIAINDIYYDEHNYFKVVAKARSQKDKNTTIWTEYNVILAPLVSVPCNYIVSIEDVIHKYRRVSNEYYK